MLKGVLDDTTYHYSIPQQLGWSDDSTFQKLLATAATASPAEQLPNGFWRLLIEQFETGTVVVHYLIIFTTQYITNNLRAAASKPYYVPMNKIHSACETHRARKARCALISLLKRLRLPSSVVDRSAMGRAKVVILLVAVAVHYVTANTCDPNAARNDCGKQICGGNPQPCR